MCSQISEMNKCLSLVHLTTNYLRGNNPTRDFADAKCALSEMNKCLTVVHLTSTFRIQSGTYRDSKARNLWSFEHSVYCAAWLLVADWFSSCCNWSNWRNWSALDELEVGLFRGLVGAKG